MEAEYNMVGNVNYEIDDINFEMTKCLTIENTVIVA